MAGSFQSEFEMIIDMDQHDVAGRHELRALAVGREAGSGREAEQPVHLLEPALGVMPALRAYVWPIAWMPTTAASSPPATPLASDKTRIACRSVPKIRFTKARGCASRSVLRRLRERGTRRWQRRDRSGFLRRQQRTIAMDFRRFASCKKQTRKSLRRSR
jgi:hypothetical protein